MTINMDTLRQEVNLKESKFLNRIARSGKDKMYKYLSGADADSTYTAQNIKYILELNGKEIDWSNVDDITNALFSIGYSDQGNIIGLLTNTNALLQDMLIYSPLEVAKENLKQILTIQVGSEKVLGKRYLVDGKSPLTLSLPVITQSNYKTMAVVIHKRHADKLIEILKTIDVDALTEEDIIALSKDLGFISRTQELAIDVAKDKTIEIVNTSQWLKAGIKNKNYWLERQDNDEGWYAKDNLLDIIDSKKQNQQLPDFKVEAVIPESVLDKVKYEVYTSESIAREVLLQATKDYFNTDYKQMLLYSAETELNQRAKATALKYEELNKAIKQVLYAYRNYMIDNIPQNIDEYDKQTAIFIRKQSKDKTTAFAKICRNTIYKLGVINNLNAYTISLIAYGIDLLEVSPDEGKYFRAIMPEEFNKLYAKGKQATIREPLFFVDEFIKDDIDDDIEIIVDFINGEAFKDNILIAKASYKYNATNAKLVFEDGRYYAETYKNIELSPVGDEILLRLENITDTTINNINEVGMTMNYTSASPNNYNLLFNRIDNNISIYASIGYKTYLPTYYRLMLLNNDKLNTLVKDGLVETVEQLLDNYDYVNANNINSSLSINKIETVNNDNEEYKTYYAIATLC